MSGQVFQVLIADNNPALCESVSAFFDDQPDMEVAGIAHDGVRALQLAATLNPDAVIVDITMPHLDGLGVLERLPMHGDRSPAVIVLSVIDRAEVMRLACRLGADRFLVKPIELEELAASVRRLVPQAAGGLPSAASHRTQEVRELLHRLAVPAHLKGYPYLRDAVEMALENDRLLAGGVTGRLYPLLARRYGVSAPSVEAAIRNLLIAWWERGNRVEATSGEHVGQAVRFRRLPTNTGMIARLATRIRAVPAAHSGLRRKSHLE